MWLGDKQLEDEFDDALQWSLTWSFSRINGGVSMVFGSTKGCQTKDIEVQEGVN